MPRWRGHLVLAVLSLLVVTACGSSGGDRAAVTSAPSGPAAVAASPTTTTAPAASVPKPANARLVLATTTSTVDSGLLDELLPAFEKETGYKVVPLSLGSGQALATAERGEADVLLVHSPDAELQFMQAGHGVDRQLVMHNDFIIVGPPNDPAGVAGVKKATEGLMRIAGAKAPFISRADNSGTNALELKLWKSAGITPSGQSWYTEAGVGMGQTLQIASERGGYTISDRATFLAQKKILRLQVVLEKDPALLNIYHVIRVNPANGAKINVEGAKAFETFVLGPRGQQIIAAFGKEKAGEPLFFPDAGKDEATLGS